MGNNYCCSSIVHSSVYIHIHIHTSLISLLVTVNPEATAAQPTIPWQFLLLHYLLGA